MNGYYFASMALLSCLFGCATASSAFEEAKQRDTISAYESFLQEYPTAAQAEEANRRSKELRESLLREVQTLVVRTTCSTQFRETLILFAAGPGLSKLDEPNFRGPIVDFLTRHGFRVTDNVADADAVLVMDCRRHLAWGGSSFAESGEGIEASGTYAKLGHECELQVNASSGENLWVSTWQESMPLPLRQSSSHREALLVADGKFRPDRKDMLYGVKEGSCADAESAVLSSVDRALSGLLQRMSAQN